MYLSKLELHGFKSFATPTVLRFDPGVTAIVGPNGCGKSNIVDAVRWVIGEQRARILRSEKMENVIFNGATKRRPLGLAEVQLTVENTRGVLPTEYAEVTLGRRLYRSGDSEYLLNSTPCRLRDITDLFMDTGMGAGAYSVIELKMIEEILSDSTYDRRHLFEEAAGITKYKQRRAQALRKLDGTQVDLTRLRDLVDEIEKRVRSLKRQALKAARFKEVEERLHRLEVMQAQVEYDRLTEHEDVLRAERAALKDTLEEHTARLAKDEAAREALRKTHVDREQVLAERQQRLNDHLVAVRDLEADARLEQERIEGACRDRDRMEREQEDAQHRQAALQDAGERVAGALVEAEPVLEKATRMLEEAQSARDQTRATAETRRETLQALRRREQQTMEERAAHHRRLDRLTNRLEFAEQEEARVQEQLAALGGERQEQEERVRRGEEDLDQASQARAAARRAQEQAEQAYEAARRRLDEAADARRRVERHYDAVAAEVQVLDSLVASFEAFSDAVRFLAATPAWPVADRKTVADVLTCEPVYRVALGAALDGLAECFVVETAQEAYEAVALLRAEEKGRATFLVMERLQEPDPYAAPSLPEIKAQPMHALVRASEPRYERVVAHLLRGVYYVGSLEQAEAAAQVAGPARYVTATGEWIDTRGMMQAGSEPSDASPVAGRMARREHLAALRERLAALQEEVKRHSAVVDSLQASLHTDSLEEHRRAVVEAEEAYATVARVHARLTYERDALEQRHADLGVRRQTLASEQTRLQQEIEPIRAEVEETIDQVAHLQARREEAEDAFQEAQAESRVAQDRLGDATVAAVETRNRYDNLQRDRERVQQDLEALEQRMATRRTHLEKVQQTITAAQGKADQVQQHLDAVSAQRTGLEDAVSVAKTGLLQIKVDIDQIEVRLRKLRQAREEVIHQEHVGAVRQAEIQTRKADLIESIREGFDLVLGVDPIEVDDGFDAEAARAEVHDLRRRIKTMGSVNALALEEYDTEKERYEFMVTQQKDLEQAETTLLETIDEINTTAAHRFEETYAAIRVSFHDLFAELFGHEASADLQLIHPHDPLESPIEIVARPRGKRPIHISQLSSGEKTLTAIALLFAIYLVKPSPFCFLDEVDAPLDDANIDRFMRLIRRFANHTQFILVTHNKRTMELADRLYGITMQEQGVSRLVGVKFEEALALAS